MIFVDTNVFMYAVGRAHPLRAKARAILESSRDPDGPVLVSSTEVLQELLHAYLPVQRLDACDAAMALVRACTSELWTVEKEDVELARALAPRHPQLQARDLVHLACCRRRSVRAIESFDRALAAAVRRG